jgi:hypothetical protein
MTILVLTADPLPLPGLAATGAGLRAWSLAEGLKSQGLDARAVMPASHLEGRADSFSQPYSKHVYPENDPADFVRRAKPSVVVAQHWGMLARLGDCACPVAVDLAGPHLLERRHWGNADVAAGGAEKIQALSRADYVFCSGRDQRLYFLPWLAMAGFDPGDLELCPSIPFCWSPEGPVGRTKAPGQGEEVVFLAGGVLLPWQNPLPAIKVLLETFDETGKGRLVFHGGAHPTLNVSGGEQEELLDFLHRHPRVECGPLLPFDEFLGVLNQADAAFDLLPRNNERELAYPIRSSMYLWAGLPVIHADYDEPGRLIAGRNAGWALDPENGGKIRTTVRSILESPAQLSERAQGARKIAAERNWSSVIGPLADFCKNPKAREGKKSISVDSREDSMRIIALQRDLEQARAEAASLRGKWPLRLARRLKALSWLAAPVVYVGVFVVAAFVALGAIAGAVFPGRKAQRGTGRT